MDKYDFDVLIIGAGPGGYVAAIRASQLGLKAAVIEKDKVGGVCLNVGCIPSKALIRQAEAYRGIADLEALGVKADVSGFRYESVFQKSRKAADTLSKGVQFLLAKNKVELIQGTGMIQSAHEVSVGGRKVTGKNLILATGSRPRVIPGFEFDEKKVLSSTGALMLDSLPGKMLILGAGAIGVEFSHVLNSFGVEVHLVEMMDRILPLEDGEAVQVVSRSFQKRGITVSTGTKAVSLDRGGSGVKVVLEDKAGKRNTVEADKALVVIGRAINTDGIGLEKIGIAPERGFIPVGDWNQTKVPGVYAIGDVVGTTPLLAHVASKEGEMAAEHIAGHKCEPRLDPLSIPSAVYCEPQIGSFGLTEEKAKDKGVKYVKAVFPYRGAGKSVAIERSEGMVKVLLDPASKEILGAHIVGAEATELIHELLLARRAELLPEDIAGMIHAHPTLSEAVMESMRAAEGWAIHA